MSEVNDPVLREKVQAFNDRINNALSKNNFSLATKLSEERDLMVIKYLVAKDKKAQQE